MTDRPIIFSAPMVRALLAGRKTQTRRLFKPRGFRFYTHPISGDRYEEFNKEGITGGGPMHPFGWGEHLYAYLPYAPGDRLYVREAWDFLPDGLPGTESNAGIRYWADSSFATLTAPADFNPMLYGHEKVRPSIHMPRWASRLTLIVEGVKIEQLREISEIDAVAEGIELHRLMGASGWTDYGDKPGDATRRYFSDPRRSFQSLWRSLHGAESWDANPFVVALTFRVIPGNIDRLGNV